MSWRGPALPHFFQLSFTESGWLQSQETGGGQQRQGDDPGGTIKAVPAFDMHGTRFNCTAAATALTFQSRSHRCPLAAFPTESCLQGTQEAQRGASLLLPTLVKHLPPFFSPFLSGPLVFCDGVRQRWRPHVSDPTGWAIQGAPRCVSRRSGAVPGWRGGGEDFSLSL